MNLCSLIRSRVPALLCLLVVTGWSARGTAAERPNILWITSEDNSPYLGCYGDRQAQTPNLDRLAAQGVRYSHAFANAPVCSTARTTLITGMFASSIGAHNHRSSVSIPEGYKLYPEHLRAAGYYCTNNSKTDYNLAERKKVWDESSKSAHYRNRAAGQPFFAVFNFTTSHESQVAPKPGKKEFRIAPAEVQLPPYHPDAPEIRRDWANYYDQMTLMDQQAGKLIEELEREGLAEDTIVFYYSDHGGALPRGKRNIHDSGTRVPMIIRFPKKWLHWAPAQPGQWCHDLVSFVDLPPTIFSMCEVPVPENYQGRAFLGPKKGTAREHVFLLRGRMDERYDTVRAVRDADCRYVRNYSPHRPWGQHYSYPFQVLPSMRAWFAEYEAGRCNEAQAAYWQAKPAEEFYVVSEDPFELTNRIGDAGQRERIERLRKALRQEMLATRDTGFIPEGMFAKLAGANTIAEYARSDAYPLEKIIDLADQASAGQVKNLDGLLAALDDPHPIMRYWAATGCLILKGSLPPDRIAQVRQSLRKRLEDEWFDVRVVAAEAIAHAGEPEPAIAALSKVVREGNPYEVLAAENSLDFLREADLVSVDRAQELVRDMKFSEPANRIPRYWLELDAGGKPARPQLRRP